MGIVEYKKGKSIGSGSFGTVFIGTHNTTGDTVVIKEVRLSGLSGKDMLKAKAEIDVLKKLRHPHIIAYRDSFKDRSTSTLSIVMEHAAGGDLGSLITSRAKSKSHIAETELIKIISQAVAAMSYCHHEIHLLHRDLKCVCPFVSNAHLHARLTRCHPRRSLSITRMSWQAREHFPGCSW